MLFLEDTERHRANAEDWVGRAGLVPADSWDRERLLTAARLSYACADLIERRRPRVWQCAPAQSTGGFSGSSGSSGSTAAVMPASLSADSRASRKDHK